MGSSPDSPTLKTFVGLLVCCSLGAFSAASAAEEPANPGKRWAVLIGVNDYVQGNDLKCCVADMQALHRQLLEAGFDDDHVTLLKDGESDTKLLPTKTNIERTLSHVAELADEGDVIVVAFSGHGAEFDGTSYLVPFDGQFDRPDTLVSLNNIYRQLKGSAASFRLVLVDACRDDPGQAGRKGRPADQNPNAQFSQALSQADTQGIVVLTSCNSGEGSQEDEQLGHGVFMYFVLQGLGGSADAEGDKNGAVSLRELSDYAFDHTKTYVLKKYGCDSPGVSDTGGLLNYAAAAGA